MSIKTLSLEEARAKAEAVGYRIEVSPQNPHVWSIVHPKIESFQKVEDDPTFYR